MKISKLTAALAFTLVTANAFADCYTCSPQCVPSARAYSGIDFPRVKFAGDIPDAVRKDKSGKLKITSTPRENAVVAVKLGAVGHAMAVVKSKKVDGKYAITLAHSNADCKCSSERVSAIFDPKTQQILMLAGLLKGKKLTVIDGFVIKA